MCRNIFSASDDLLILIISEGLITGLYEIEISDTSKIFIVIMIHLDVLVCKYDTWL